MSWSIRNEGPRSYHFAFLSFQWEENERKKNGIESSVLICFSVIKRKGPGHLCMSHACKNMDVQGEVEVTLDLASRHCAVLRYPALNPSSPNPTFAQTILHARLTYLVHKTMSLFLFN